MADQQPGAAKPPGAAEPPAAAADLARAVGLCPGDVAAFTGGGGKTSLCLAVARASGAIFTTTTRILVPEGMPVVLLEEGGDLASLPAGPVCVASRRLPGEKLAGLSPDLVEALHRVAAVRGWAGRAGLPGAVIVEADGSAGLPLKAPAAHEPVIPPCATLVVSVAGASAFGRPIAAMHRPDHLAAAAGRAPAQPVDAAVMAAGLRACTRGAPPGARLVGVVNQCDLLADLSPAREALAGFARGVLAGNGDVLGRSGPVAAVVLAGGAARRFGSPKQLAAYGGTTLIEATLRSVLQAGFAEVVVVEGAVPLAGLLAPYPVRVVRNEAWADGMSSSIRAGLRSLPAHIGAAVMQVADQPRTPAALLRQLAAAWQEGAKVAAPFAGGRWWSPVLFDRALWPELMAVTGDEGGRSVVRRHEADLVRIPWPDASAFADIDTPGEMPL